MPDRWSSPEQVAQIVKQCLEEGKTVEIDGLGSFQPDSTKGYQFIPLSLPTVFIAYVQEDAELADRLFDDFAANGFDPWLDRRKLLPGQNWPRSIESLVRTWWEGRIVPSLKEGRNVIRREDTYALYEMLHVMRDNFNVDLRDSARAFFKSLPIYHLVSYYPATYPAPENEYRIPATKGAGEPDLYRAALSRATELSMVSYDNNAPESQVLQGWLMHDNFLMRGTFGAPYEFFWANPYQPGLSYYLVPLVFHDDVSGRLFIRSTWDESATWLGFFDGQLQLFQDGKVTILNPQLSSPPIELEPAVVLFGQSSQKFKIDLKEDEEVFVLGLKPSRLYAIEIDDEEMTEARTDPGGILALNLPRKVAIGVRLHEEIELRVAQPVQEPAK